jgi:macrolide transport system ATP-binding/permease protein
MGRDFSPRDGQKARPVAIVNQSMVRKYFVGENPIGHRIGMDKQEPGIERTIIGVVKDMKFSNRDDMPAAAIYLPYAQAPGELRGQAEIKVNTLLDSAVMIPAIRNEVQAVARDLPSSQDRD